MTESASTEARLRAEIETLKARLEAVRGETRGRKGHPRKSSLWAIAIAGAALVACAFLTGYLPHIRRQSMLIAEAKADGEALPTVNVITVERSPGRSELVLPGNIQAVTEAPVLSRASGYVKRRYADIGDRVSAGQVLAEIDAAELGQQVSQAKASLEQTSASLEQATADLEQGKTNEQMAKVTAQRWSSLAARGVVSRQENDNYQAQFEAQRSRVQSLAKAVNVAKSNIKVTEANLARLSELQGYLKVRAPFAGVITQRNVDVGALATEGATLLFRIAQTDRLRTFVNVPQADAGSVHVGQPAKLIIPDIPNRQFAGTVTRTANALDPSSRTLLTEVQVSNADAILMPGMYAQVDLTTPRSNPPLIIPGDTLVVRADGPQVALVTDQQTVHFQRIQLGRDYGDKIEVVAGLEAGERVIVNPGDTVRERVKVNAVLLRERLAAPISGH